MLADIIGSMAAILTTLSFLPQTVKTIKTRETAGISLWMYIIFSAGVFLWLVYGVMIDNMPIIISNSITLPAILTILAIKVQSLTKKK